MNEVDSSLEVTVDPFEHCVAAAMILSETTEVTECDRACGVVDCHLYVQNGVANGDCELAMDDKDDAEELLREYGDGSDDDDDDNDGDFDSLDGLEDRL